jgi:hypothetical protein
MTYKQLFKEINILTLASLYILEVTRFIKKILSVSGATTLNVRKYNSRRILDILVQSYKTDIHKKSVINMGTKLYNNMPHYIKGMDNYKAFNSYPANVEYRVSS